MKSTFKVFAKIGFILAALAVALGAFGAHALRDALAEKEMQVYETAIKYLFYHTLAIITLALNYRKFNTLFLTISLGIMLLGIFIFSGSLLLLSTRSLWGSDDYKFIGAITPIGGILFILSWLLLFFKGFSINVNNEDNQPHGQHSHRSHQHKSRRSRTGNTANKTV
jgi:uncharacterized membrane protein YgdD (TMEM256/DUF423 family)